MMMMARILLGVLCLSGWCISTCLLHQYHYVAGPLTWTEAQTFCRKTYTDLATFGSPEEKSQLLSTLSSAGVNSDVWIGLYSKIVWRWSNGYRGDGAEYRNWNNNPNDEPDFSEPNQFCVCTAKDGRWWDSPCDDERPFICMAGTELEPEFVFVNKKMNWSAAQKHCRENSTDLATVRNNTENTKMKIMLTAKWTWIGLFRDPNMYWSDGSGFTDLSVRDWATSRESLGSKTVICGVASVKHVNQLSFTGCEKRLPFVCYSAPPPGERFTTNPTLVPLTGWCISTCLLHQYHYVAGPLTWTEAQTFCRKTYTDLATIGSPEEKSQLLSTLSSAGVNSDVWIGLYSKIVWRWSNGYRGDGAEYRNWKHYPHDEPDFSQPNAFCVCTGDDGGWWDSPCHGEQSFMCMAGTELEPEFVFVNKKMNWSAAQKHCRENSTDLATVRNNTENTKMKMLTTTWTWIGLFRDPNMYWSDGSGFTDLSVRDWATSRESLGSKTVICGVASVKNVQLSFTGCEKRLPFVCYSAPPPAPVKRQVVKLRIKSSVDLNAVKEEMLRKLQDKLEEKGVSGVTLKWREQPDGKVFHKERKGKKTEL
ncbi:C-type mannose receptor 2 [Larimichthys crocea]|uniref:C-type mannose receptor 2 n=1 Tax=Larimichthys crocea TaxID=215358 RepID=UPI000F5EC038|nr:C-type mannose receptor 2 [Larimichthys crocea]